MNDTELDAVLDLIHADLREAPAPSSLHERVRTIPSTTPRERGWLPRFDVRGSTMLSTLKFVAAAAIVALFGGFLLAGILTAPQGDEMAPAAMTASPSPMTTEELLSRMVTEEVEPGVYRVVNDGVRDLMPASRITVGDDGSVWGSRDWGALDGGIFRLGDEFIDTRHNWVQFVTPDGTLWAEDLHTYDGEQWTEQPAPPTGSDEFRLHDLGGTVWTAWSEPQQPEQWTVARLDGDEWRPLEAPLNRRGPRYDDTWAVELLTADGEDLWAWREPYFPTMTGGPGTKVMSRWVEGEWQEVFRTGVRGAGEPTSVHLLALGPDGTSWLLQHEWIPDDNDEPGVAHKSLKSFDGSEWRQWDLGDLEAKVPTEAGVEVYGIGVSPDGSLWVSLQDTWSDMVGESVSPVCHGVARFDGERWDRYLVDLCTHAHLGHMGPDGSVWALAGTDFPGDGEGWGDDGNWWDLYVITPEAVAATE